MAWYVGARRELPWRRDRDPYRILVSEFMLQQTTVAAVVPLYERWMSTFPTMEALANAEIEDVMKAWSGLGYYQRARRLHQTAQVLAGRTEYPSTLLGWLELPGLGSYTAAAVTSIAYGLPHLALDTNALRVLLRYRGSREPVEKVSTHRALKVSLEPQLHDIDAGLFNQAVMELGAIHCAPKAPNCSACPIKGGCRARSLGNQEEIPRRKAKKPTLATSVASYIITDEQDRILLLRGTALGLLQDLYQPPIDAFAENRADWDLLGFLVTLRERQRNLDLCASVTVAYNISGRRLEIKIYSLSWDEALAKELQSASCQTSHPFAWAAADSAASGPAISSLTRKIISAWMGSRPTLQPTGETSGASAL